MILALGMARNLKQPIKNWPFSYLLKPPIATGCCSYHHYHIVYLTPTWEVTMRCVKQFPHGSLLFTALPMDINGTNMYIVHTYKQYMYIYIYMYTHIYIYMYTYICTHKSFSLQSGPITLYSGPIESWVAIFHKQRWDRFIELLCLFFSAFTRCSPSPAGSKHSTIMPSLFEMKGVGKCMKGLNDMIYGVWLWNHSASLSELTWHSRWRYQNMEENILENKIWQSRKMDVTASTEIFRNSLLKT